MASFPAGLWGLIDLDKCVKSRGPSLNRSQEIPPQTVGGGICDRFFCYNFQPEVNSDVISGVAVDHVSMVVPVKFGDSRSNGF